MTLQNWCTADESITRQAAISFEEYIDIKYIGKVTVLTQKLNSLGMNVIKSPAEFSEHCSNHKDSAARKDDLLNQIFHNWNINDINTLKTCWISSSIFP